MSSSRSLICLVVLIVSGSTSLVGQTPARYAPCRAALPADSSWSGFSIAGLRLTLRLPAKLRPVRYKDLDRMFRREQVPEISRNLADSVVLAAGWAAPAKDPGDIQQVFLYTISGSYTPFGRPCSLSIAGKPGLAFLRSLSGGSQGNEYWAEAYWPGFVLAIRGGTLDSYEVAFRILRAVAAMP